MLEKMLDQYADTDATRQSPDPELVSETVGQGDVTQGEQGDLDPKHEGGDSDV